jgi:hypothetical protein
LQLGSTSVALLLLLCVGIARPQPPASDLPADPILRLDTKSHGAMIIRIATDAQQRFAVTASHDKTARIWSLPDGRLLQVLRLPSDQGNIGKAFAVAVSPDGATVAVGGWTGPPRHNNIYLFDRASGTLKRRLPELPEVVLHLAFSPDGRRLAAGLGGKSGIRTFDATDGFRPLPSDHAYGAQTYWLDFDQQGRLVTACLDGHVRLYEPDRYDSPVANVASPAGPLPFSAMFSPDGKSIAVGNWSTPGIAVLSAADLSLLYKPDAGGVVNGDIASVGWSEDGRFLFAGGTTWSRFVRRWDDAGRGPHTDITGMTNSVMQFLPLHDGRMLVEATDGFGIIDQAGKIDRLQTLAGFDLRGAQQSLRISPDGKIVQIAPFGARHTLRFALAQRLVAVDPPLADLALPMTTTPGLTITGWANSRTPSVNGKPLALYKDETARSFGIVPGTDHFVLGADWSVRLFDATGRELWSTRESTPAVAWGVNVTGDSRLVVIAFGDGTSAGADDLIGWHVNRGYDQGARFLRGLSVPRALLPA